MRIPCWTSDSSASGIYRRRCRPAVERDRLRRGPPPLEPLLPARLETDPADHGSAHDPARYLNPRRGALERAPFGQVWPLALHDVRLGGHQPFALPLLHDGRVDPVFAPGRVHDALRRGSWVLRVAEHYLDHGFGPS